MAITGNGEQEEAPVRGRGRAPEKGKGKGIMTLSPTIEVPRNPKVKGKLTSPYKERSKLDVPLSEEVTKEEYTGFAVPHTTKKT